MRGVQIARSTLAKRKLIPSYKTIVVEQLLKFKYYAAHLGVFNTLQLSEIDGILNKAMRQATKILSNFPTEGLERPSKWELNT
jgi:hypothetical protein